MKRKQNLTFEQKREKMLNIFHQKEQANKKNSIHIKITKKNIVLQAVKDVLVSLMSDGLVDSDKIGSSNFYWSLPSQTYVVLQQRLKEIEQKTKESIQKKEELENQFEEAIKGKGVSEERNERLQKLKEIQENYKKKLEKLEKYQRFDPERINQLKKDVNLIKQKANLWTDNIFAVKQYVQKQFNISEQEIEQFLNIPADIDNI
ncbi:hypothetical protein IMG5_152360 [Ichthyophthirius multifiliis]|uniref:Meiotic nuclear division protein 1 n=1 Tax=Ichthyophthirius multifiliis TaxID=5932 RepID=G0QYV0_ICHMU|nr:hypothetical protein IMG5_152360 [Ichthyophthirius multifiliis]EGR29606.1 hypothetical protein IMG5_152360 [Ichthyophthirius multifiliis]|eukprot:XP_004030842.1 hypothetical protein IMG5_152360 [Ichthyophthirius multifiliis]